MILFPAIDLMDGEVVRLEQGRADRKKVYSSNPLEFALRWQDAGADWLHLVDLDGAFTGEPKNAEVVRSIVSTLKIPVELGGGLRTLETAERVLKTGVARAILGSRACEDSNFVKEAVAAFGGEKIAVGIDAKDGFVATRGWVETSKRTAIEVARESVALGVKTIIYTDIATDGMLLGPNIEAMRSMLAEVPGVQLIASGGVSSYEDIRQLNAIPGLYGTIIGKALYEDRVELKECLSITR